MITHLITFESTGYDPYENLALEKHLMDITLPGQCILYLWQNQNTVVIGKNQNAWNECRISLLQEEGGILARRLSGGGAVFHDLGNLNFTFIMRKEDYDLDKQLSVIQQACRLAGIPAEKSGRNDLLVHGKKFSGNAFYQNRTHAYHHGTLMIDVDTDKLGRYLSPPKAKLEAKGISSVRSRVTNLKNYAPALTVSAMKQYMIAAFCHVYGLPVSPLALSETDLVAVNQLRDEYCSWEFLYGSSLPFRFQCEALFTWGHCQIQLNMKDGLIVNAKVYSDTMDWTVPEIAENVLTGCRFDAPSIQAALVSSTLPSNISADIYELLENQCL